MTRQRVFYNSLSAAVLFGVNLIVTFFMSPVIVRQLGNDGYGIWEILLSVFGYLSILELGVGPAFIRFVARAAGQNDHHTMNKVVSSAFVVLTAAGLVGLVTATALLNAPPPFLKLDQGSNPEIGSLGLLLGANFFVSLTGAVFTAYLMGLQRHYVMNFARVLLTALQAGITYIALTRWPGSGLVWLAAILLVANFLQFGFFAIWSLVRKPAPVIRLSNVSRTTIRELYVFGLKSVMLMIATRVSQGSVPIVMGWILGVGQVVFYAIPNRLATYAAGLGVAIGSPIMPYLSSLGGVGDSSATLRAWFMTTRMLQVIMFGMAVGILGLGCPFISRWIGPQYASQGAWVIRALGAALIVQAVSPNSSRLLVSLNLHGAAAIASLTIALLGVPLTIALAKLLGVPGVGLSVLLIITATEISQFALALRALRLSALEHLRRTVLPFLPATALFAVTLIGLRRLQKPDDYDRLITYALVGGAVYLAGVWLFALGRDERAAVSSLLWTRARHGL